MLAPDHAPLILSMSSAVSALSRYHVIMTRHKGNTSPITQISEKREGLTITYLYYYSNDQYVTQNQ